MQHEVTRLKAERLRRRWTLRDLARKTRVSHTDISKIERLLAKPYPSQALRLAKAVGLTGDQLLEVVRIQVS